MSAPRISTAAWLAAGLLACTTAPEPTTSRGRVFSAGGEAVHGAVPYQVVESWSIPNGGYGRVIVISPKYSTDSALQQLGLQLLALGAGDRNSFAFVYDSPKAADMRDDLPEDEGPRGQYYDRHFLGAYVKNGNTGVNEWTFSEHGFVHASHTIRY